MTAPAPLLAYHGNPEVKSAIIAELVDHAAHDRLVKGRYWENGKGCAVGCTIHSGNHAEYEPRFGVPQMLAYLEDTIFEGLPNVDAMAWPVRFMSAIPVNADLSLVGWQFLDRLLLRVFARIDASDPVHAGCSFALEIISAKARGETVSASAARSAASAAWSVASAASAARSAARSAESAARSAAWSAESAAGSAESAARSAARSAESAAGSAAWSAESAAWSAAWSAESAARSAAEYRQQADDLCELMAAAPVALALTRVSL